MERRWKIPLAKADIGPQERRAVESVLRSGTLSRGPHLEELERVFAQYLGRKHGIGLNSGTSGLHASLVAAEVEPGDWVLTTPLSFIASSNCILHAGAIPIFVDVEAASGNWNPELAQEAIHDLTGGSELQRRRWLPPAFRDAREGRLAALLPVHLFGQCSPLEPMMKVAAERGLAVIEDTCEALGARASGRMAGTQGDAAVFGFYANKQMTMGEGGMVVTDHDLWARRIRSLRNQGRQQPNWTRGPKAGFNYRLDEMSAALGLVQLRRLEELLEKRRQVAGWYLEQLSGLKDVTTLQDPVSDSHLSWFVFIIRTDNEARQRLQETLREERIECRIYFPPIHLQEPFKSLLGYGRGAFPVAEQWGETSLALPFFPQMKPSQVERVCSVVRRVCRQAAGSNR
ncbi:MAG TPA: DegT/DnrJ/EryC1/StrS family aminotransferase [Acidobacteriota bacterium]|nr:DegT/DnrJ/EryC1/StrS family aminotransferase [Acidobacteriota bacterium]